MKKYLSSVLAAVFSVCICTLAANAATYYPITINYEPTATVADFPVLVRIPTGSGIYASAGEGGANLRFTDALGVNNYPHEVDTWNASGESLVWVKIPELKKDFEFRLYCSGTDTTAAKDIWSAYAGVWHLNAAVDSAEKDFDIDGVTHTTKFFGGSQAIVDAPIGTGRGQPSQGVAATFTSKVYDGRNGHKVPLPMISDATKVTFSCWARPTMAWTAWKTFIGPRSAHNGDLGVTIAGADSLRLENKSTGTAWESYKLPADKGFAVNSWMQFVFVFDKKSQQIYMNGASIGSKKELSDDPTWNYAGWMGWGGNVGQDGAVLDDNAQAIDFDECRIYDGVVSAAQVAADYATVKDPDFLTIGPATEEQEIPEGTVAQVGATYYQDFAEAVAASESSGDFIILMANDQSWTFTTEGETLCIKLSGMSFSPVNGPGDGFYIAEALDSATAVTTFTLKKQVKVAAMRNVAVYKQLHTRDLAELLPAQVAGLDADGSIVGVFDVIWDVEDITKYDHFGVTQVPGLATVGGEQWPVTAYVRATLEYSDNYHNIAQEANSMVVTAPAVDGNTLVENLKKISDNSPSVITNGVPATARVGVYVGDTTGSFSNWNSGNKDPFNPYLSVNFTWGEVKRIRRIEIIARTTNNMMLDSATITAGEETIAGPVLAEVNYAKTENINSQYTHRYDFATPVETKNVNVTLKQATTHMDLQEILIWSDGTPLDKNEMSTSAELTELEMDGKSVMLEPGKTSYIVQGAKEVTLAKGEANVGVTVLPEVDGLIRIITMGEDGSSETYKIKTHGGLVLFVR